MLNIGYFLEDNLHERFFIALTGRIAGELGVAVAFEVRNATGGRGQVMAELRGYLQDVRAGRQPVHPILVVAIDGNCQTYQARRNEIQQVAEQTGYPGDVVCAVPDPHVERWYLADIEGFKRAIESSQPPPLPAYKCEHRRYKDALRHAFRTAGISPQLGGAEYAQEIVAAMDLYRAAQADAAFKHFLDDLRTALSRYILSG